MTEAAAPGAMRVGHTWTSLSPQFLKGAIAQIPKNCPRSFVGVLRQLALDFGVNVPCSHEQIRVAIVIEGGDARSPTDIASLNCHVRRTGYIVKTSLSVITVEAVGIIGEMGLKQIEMPFQLQWVFAPGTGACSSEKRM